MNNSNQFNLPRYLFPTNIYILNSFRGEGVIPNGYEFMMNTIFAINIPIYIYFVNQKYYWASLRKLV